MTKRKRKGKGRRVKWEVTTNTSPGAKRVVEGPGRAHLKEKPANYQEAVAEAGVGESLLPPEEVSGRQERTTFTETTEAPGGGPAQGLETGLVGLVLVTGLGEVEVGPGRETAQETAMTEVSGAQGLRLTRPSCWPLLGRTR